MRRIAYYAHTGCVSGPNNSLARLLRGIDRTRFDPVVYFPSDGPVVEALAGQGERCRVLDVTPLEHRLRNAPRYLADLFCATRRIRDAFKLDRIDLVHINTCTTPHAAVAARSLNIPVLVHIRETVRANLLNDTYLKILSMLAHRIIAVSQAVYENVRARTWRGVSKMVVIHNGIDFESFDVLSRRHVPREALGLPVNRKLIALPAFLLPRHKGHEVLLKATVILVHELGIRNICVLVIGDESGGGLGLFAAALKRYCEEHALTDYVRFLGLRTDVPALLAHADIVCLPSSYDDPLPNAVLEGMAAGKPVVGTAVGGIPELIQDQRTGILIPRDDARALAGALAHLVTDEARAVQMGEAGRRRVEQEFNNKIHAGRVQAVYEELLAR